MVLISQLGEAIDSAAQIYEILLSTSMWVLRDYFYNSRWRYQFQSLPTKSLRLLSAGVWQSILLDLLLLENGAETAHIGSAAPNGSS